MNDIYIDTYNPIFQILHELYDSSAHTHRKEAITQNAQNNEVTYTRLAQLHGYIQTNETH
jgi:uncharacterized protein with NAD-binding domain and iron-sulfur cluster